MTVIKITDVKKFVGPLKSLLNSVNSVIFTKKGTTFMVNTKSDDSTQMSNIWYKPEIIKIESGNIEKFGIYKLSEFVSVLSLFGDINSVTLNINANVMSVVFSEKMRVDYILSDVIKNPELIKEGTIGPKTEIPFLATFELDVNFIKKVKQISSTIGANILRIKSVGGILSYSISDKGKQKHSYTEDISEGGQTPDFDVAVTIKDDKRDNFGILFDGSKYNVGVHNKVIQFQAVNEDFELLRYFISPLSPTEK